MGGMEEGPGEGRRGEVGEKGVVQKNDSGVVVAKESPKHHDSLRYGSSTPSSTPRNHNSRDMHKVGLARRGERRILPPSESRVEKDPRGWVGEARRDGYEPMAGGAKVFAEPVRGAIAV